MKSQLLVTSAKIHSWLNSLIKASHQLQLSVSKMYIKLPPADPSNADKTPKSLYNILAVESAHVNKSMEFPLNLLRSAWKINKTAAEIVGRKKGRGGDSKCSTLFFNQVFLNDGNDVTWIIKFWVGPGRNRLFRNFSFTKLVYLVKMINLIIQRINP